MSHKPKQLKKRTKWTDTEEQYLLELWEEKFEMLRGSRKNSHIYKEISNCFLSRNRLFSPEEISVKIHNLTNRYKKEKQLIGPSGGSPSEWKLYHQVHAILGQLRIHNLETVVEESIETEFISMSEITTPSPPLTSSPPASSDVWSIVDDAETPIASTSNAARKRNRRNLNALRSEASEKRIMLELKEIQKSDEELLNVERERNAILDRFVSSSEQFQANLMAYLNANK